MKELEKRVKEAAESISPHLKVVTCGSYRRGRSDCGDIDCLVTHKKGGIGRHRWRPYSPGTSTGEPLDGVLTRLLGYLRGADFITDDLTSGKKGDVYMGGTACSTTLQHL